MQKLKVGSLVKIIDGNYAIRVDQYEKSTHIGLCEDIFKVINIIYTDHIQLSDGIKVHNIVIENTVNGKKYLHTKAFVSHIKVTEITLEKAEKILNSLNTTEKYKIKVNLF